MDDMIDFDEALCFPEDFERSIEVQHELEGHFKFAARIFRYWKRAPKEQWLRHSGLTSGPLRILLALDFQLIRFTRALIEATRRSDALSACVVARSMLETLIAIKFLTKPKIHIHVKPVLHKKNRTHLKDRDGLPKYSAQRPPGNKKKKEDLLTRDLRTRLYLAQDPLSADKITSKLIQTPGLKRIGRKRQKLIDPQVFAEVEKSIGLE